MLQNLRYEAAALYYVVNGARVEGANERLTGDCSGLSGDCSGLRGDCTGLRGDLNACELSEEERKQGVHIADLIGE